MNPSIQGAIAAFFTYVAWGLFPVYFKQISAVAPVDIIAWRILLAFLCLLLLFILWQGPKKLIDQLKVVDQWWLLIASTLLLSTNWLVFVFAMENNQVLESSLGYYLVPIISVGLGVLAFNEKPNKFKVLAMVVATIGMLVTFLVAGVLPWISLALGGTFGLYGMLRKKARYDSAIGLFMETAVLIPIATLYLIFIAEPLSTFDETTLGWVYLLGIVTAAPLLTMIFAARRIELGTLGFFQYITPTMHLLLAVVVYNEVIDLSRFIALISTLIAVALWLIGSSSRFTSSKSGQTAKPTRF